MPSAAAPIIGAGASLIGASKQRKAQEKAAQQSRELPPWLEPYVTGQGQVPDYLYRNPQINTNWMNNARALSEGAWNTPYAPMTAQSPWLDPSRTFTPEMGGGMGYGTVPQGGGYAPPPQQMPAQPAGPMAPQGPSPAFNQLFGPGTDMGASGIFQQGGPGAAWMQQFIGG